jgi:hypothetical protein
MTHYVSELYEGLKIVQRGRLEDQRGTEINFEMPDFLKKVKNYLLLQYEKVSVSFKFCTWLG